MEKQSYPAQPILLVDDEAPWLRALTIALARNLGVDNVISTSDSREGEQLAESVALSAVILDVTMPHLSGEELLARIVARQPEVPVIMLTGRNQLEIAVRCMKLGAFDYYLKTTEEDRLMSGVRRALEVSALRRENTLLREGLLDPRLRQPEVFAALQTRSRRMFDIFRYVEAIASSPEPVLITGESGTGKELIARAIHAAGKKQVPWVAVNVAGLDDLAFSDTLFGHRRGAFTGAAEQRPGMIERAAGGVLFLDEIGDLSAASQIKLLRVLQEGEFYPLGSDHPSRLQARLVFATNHNLEELIASGRFRRDLYHRLHAHHIHLPPLRERFDDLPLLLDHFLATAAATLGKSRPTPPPELVQLLRTYHFPGNLRELRGMIYDAVSRHEGRVLSMESFRMKIAPGTGAVGPEKGGGHLRCAAGLYSQLDRLPTIQEAIDELIVEAMERAGGTISIAAGSLGISRPALSKRLSAKARDSG